MDDDTDSSNDIYDEIPDDNIIIDDATAKQDSDDEDSGAPFSEPDDADHTLPDDHPDSDTDVDEQDLYDEGISSASADLVDTDEIQEDRS